MTDHLTRRDFVTTASALAGAALLPSTATAGRAPAGPAEGTVVLFQGDSITDCGRDRSAAAPNQAGALGTGYPLLVAAAALAAHPDRALRFYNRGISGNKVPDLAARWATDTVALAPDALSILIGVNDFWHKLSSGYTGTVQDYEHQYAALLDDTRRALPRVRLIVLEPFVLRCGATLRLSWLRDGHMLAGRHARGYLVRTADEGHALACQTRHSDGTLQRSLALRVPRSRGGRAS